MHDTYSILRHFADSWMLLAMTLFFLGACLWTFRPGARDTHDEAARAIFRDSPPPVAGCGKGCPGCNCQPKDPT